MPCRGLRVTRRPSVKSRAEIRGPAAIADPRPSRAAPGRTDFVLAGKRHGPSAPSRHRAFGRRNR
ncbi:hypothetical protein Ssi03_31660 [Sphaerisporangium siamense]|nr:hypothetical protein Ssi03_31660 [Sphaerisporangium siamense]